MKVKICGVTNPSDAEFAAQAGADYIGIIFAEKSRRCVSCELAREIIQMCGKATPVGVFGDEPQEAILKICEALSLTTLQLHGTSFIFPNYTVIYANRNFLNSKAGDILLFDSATPGSGKTFDWNSFIPPRHTTWFLAGGLNPINVKDAIQKLRPHGVDVASGVEFPGSTKKDHALIQAFIRNAKEVL